MTATLSLLIFELDSLRMTLPPASVERVEPACEVTWPGARTAVPEVLDLQGESRPSSICGAGRASYRIG